MIASELAASSNWPIINYTERFSYHVRHLFQVVQSNRLLQVGRYHLGSREIREDLWRLEVLSCQTILSIPMHLTPHTSTHALHRLHYSHKPIRGLHERVLIHISIPFSSSNSRSNSQPYFCPNAIAIVIYLTQLIAYAYRRRVFFLLSLFQSVSTKSII